MLTHALRTTLTGRPDAPLVLLGNFEVEEQWATGEQGLPTVSMPASKAIVHRMDEFALLLAGPGDSVVLKTAPDPGYLAYLRELGLASATVLTPAGQEPHRTVTGDALADPSLGAELARAAAAGAWLWPHGVSAMEERLAAVAGIPLAGPPERVCKAVNSKIYSRLVADDTGVPQPAGLVCRDIDEWDAACELATTWLADGRPVVVKDAFGVSGKGILVVRAPDRLASLRRLIARRADRSGRRELSLVVEEWLPKQTDLNYQFTVGRDGSVHWDFVREALTSNGVHKGHRMPAGLTQAQVGELMATATALGSRLGRDGFYGVVGVDALTCVDGRLYPMIEINARNNMSTYQERLRVTLVPAGHTALATQYPLRLAEPVTFDRLRELLDGLLLAPGGARGAVINNFATVNAGASTRRGELFDGRLYAVVVAETTERIAELDRAIGERLGTWDGRAAQVPATSAR
ncbi:phosphoribosylglycinamide formyltransferase 2 [Actinoplanes cyaneus]|uniref:Phosphoribosylglycinamide formyltransferase 2 n=1 Tax=Actinoplanes cyaneus TaxID=52696 RepID=A0A919M946_9ACTN|nr:ATP-grasp domain-containing protein [Actinoplanes cyaneus]MCW2138213.1 ATP-grasp domain-containing protein [Actinoplanes cyaneus]GID70492.1 phosphoribosylglycinamide formyltransferase 2 [Actinoplanes cyaneus]